MQLEELRDKPGYKFREAGRRSHYMVLSLCAGMIRDGDHTGGKHSIAVARLQTGNTLFMPSDNYIELV